MHVMLGLATVVTQFAKCHASACLTRAYSVMLLVLIEETVARPEATKDNCVGRHLLVRHYPAPLMGPPAPRGEEAMLRGGLQEKRYCTCLEDVWLVSCAVPLR